MPDLHGGAPDQQLVDIMRRIRQDARSDPQPAELAQPITINFVFDGVGSLPAVGDTIVYPIGLISARIIGAVVAADGVGSAVIDLRHGTLTDLPTLHPISGSSGAPQLVNAAADNIDITGWTTNLQPSDVFIAKLVSVSGALTNVTLSLQCRRLKFPNGASTAVDTSGDLLVTTTGALITVRK